MRKETVRNYILVEQVIKVLTVQKGNYVHTGNAKVIHKT